MSQKIKLVGGKPDPHNTLSRLFVTEKEEAAATLAAAKAAEAQRAAEAALREPQDTLGLTIT
jgi:hypothetical protein